MNNLFHKVERLCDWIGLWIKSRLATAKKEKKKGKKYFNFKICELYTTTFSHDVA